MSELHLPWLQLLVLVPAVGALWVGRIRQPDVARKHCLTFTGLTLLLAIGAWQDFYSLNAVSAHDPSDVVAALLGDTVLTVDRVNAPLLPMAALLYFLTSFATLRTKIRRYPFVWALASEAILLATFSCTSAWGIIGLLAIGTLPPVFELRARKKPLGVYALHMGLFVALLVSGWALIQSTGETNTPSIIGVSLLTAAILIRSGAIPVHCWITDLFEHATFGTALLFVTPMVGAYGAVRLLLPVAPDWALRGVAIISLITAVYAAGMALVQHEARRFFCYLFLSHSSLVLVGLETANLIGLVGALCVWLSVGLALSGFGLVLRAMESRTGRLSLRNFHGLYEHVPMMSSFFILTGLASVGFPGTIGFVATELLVEGAVSAYPYVGTTVVLAAALNGIAVIYAYFRIFTGARHHATLPLFSRVPERIAVLTLTVLLIGGGLLPQPGVTSRYEAAMEIAKSRRVQREPSTQPTLAGEQMPTTETRLGNRPQGPFGLSIK